MNDEIRRLSQLKKRIEEAIDGGSTEIPKWLEESEESQTLLRDVEVSALNANSSYRSSSSFYSWENRPIPSCSEPRCESEAKCFSYEN